MTKGNFDIDNISVHLYDCIYNIHVNLHVDVSWSKLALVFEGRGFEGSDFADLATSPSTCPLPETDGLEPSRVLLLVRFVEIVQGNLENLKGKFTNTTGGTRTK